MVLFVFGGGVDLRLFFLLWLGPGRAWSSVGGFVVSSIGRFQGRAFLDVSFLLVSFCPANPFGSSCVFSGMWL